MINSLRTWLQRRRLQDVQEHAEAALDAIAEIRATEVAYRPEAVGIRIMRSANGYSWSLYDATEWRPVKEQLATGTARTSAQARSKALHVAGSWAVNHGFRVPTRAAEITVIHLPLEER